MRINLGEEEQPEIGLIALIDCIFFLLMFFMVATSFKQKTDFEKQKQLPLVLPESSASLAIANNIPNVVVIGIDKSGIIYFNGVKTSIQDLQTQLHIQASKNPTQRIRIDGDQMAAYQHIIRILDLCQLEGLTNLSMHTRN